MYVPHFDWVQFTINAVLGIDWSHKHAARKMIIMPLGCFNEDFGLMPA